MASQKDNLAELTKLGVTQEASAVEGILPLKGDESATQVADILKATKKAIKDAKGADNQDDADESDADGKVLVWVKGRTYINDTQRIDGGFYKIALPLPDRLAKSPTSVVEVFADEVPPRKLTEIAKWSGIAHPEDYKDNELLAKIIVTDWKPF